MFLRVFHQTHYLYRAPITDSYNEVRLRPATTDERRLEFFLLNVYPPVRLQHFRDENLNYVHWFEMPDPHTELRVEAQSHVHTTSQYANGLPAPVDFAGLAAATATDDTLHPFLVESHYVSMEPEFWRLAVDIRDGRDDVFATAVAIMDHLNGSWRYDSTATDVSTPMREAMDRQAGVCQDFAHAMIPARYVSGYVYDSAGGLRGAQASHAWCEIHLPGQGWFGLDPTNRCLADERHVKIATGRDYDDAAPIRGRLVGPANATAALRVVVDIECLG
jgi:transglutaminase-like putative cysteine protease